MLSEKIVALRRKSGLSQEQLAEQIGVSRQAISKWEGGLSTPELDKLQALSRFFQVSLDELAGEQALSEDPSLKNVPQESSGKRSKTARSRLGIGLCILGGVCLIVSGSLVLLYPMVLEPVNASSAVTLNGTGILMTFFALLMAAGIVLAVKKR